MRLALVACLIATPALAYENTMTVVSTVSNVLGSEAACGLAISPEAMAAYVTASLDPAASVSNAIALLTGGTERKIEAMSASAKAAHCAAVKQTAEHYGLLE